MSANEGNEISNSMLYSQRNNDLDLHQLISPSVLFHLHCGGAEAINEHANVLIAGTAGTW